MRVLSVSLLLALSAHRASAQNSTIAANASTTVASPTSLVSAIDISVDQLWDLFVGSITRAAVTTTVSATPVPSTELIPPPFLNDAASFPPGRQVPLATKNSSWSFPSGFWWGVASAAYQVEGAARDEGRGPSIWDVLTHRVIGYTIANDTGDVANNQYYLYKQGECNVQQ